MSSINRKNEILSAALTCFTSQTIEMTSIEQIGKMANASTGSIYHHFGSKEGIALSLYHEGIQSLNSFLIEKTGQCATVDSFIDQCIDANIEWITTNPLLTRFILNYRYIAHIPNKDHVINDISMPLVDTIISGITHRSDNTAGRKYPDALYVPIIFGPLYHYVYCWLEGVYPSPPSAYGSEFKNIARACMN